MNTRMKRMCRLAAGSALMVVGAGPIAAVDFELSALNDQVLGVLAPDYVSGTITPVQYGNVGTSRVLVLRAGVPVICARPGAPAMSKYMVVDPNGYYEDTSLQYQAPVDAPMLANEQMTGWIRGSDGIPFGTATYVAGGQAPLFFASNVGAQCVALPATDTTPGVATCPGAVDTTDGIFGNRFEPPTGDGELSLSSRVVSSDVAWLVYEHVLSAQGGPVSGLRLREQFAHASLGNGQPVFKHSLGMMSSWSCQASEGATCGGDGRSGLGYIRLDNVNLSPNSCIRIVATRPRRSDGVENVPFSGRVFTAAFYQRSNGQSYVQDVATTRIVYAQ